MIAVRIDRKVENDNYRALALYVAGYTENNPAEKMLDAWVTGCVSENFSDVLMEIEAVQGMARNTERDKSYHLMLSFRPEDEAKLTPEILRDIEARFAEALGFSEHQRCCGVHKNTNNIHMHLAINTVHPESFKLHEPYRDFFTLARIRAEIEQEYGLVVDNGIEPGRGEPKRPNTRAQTMEAHSGQESFDSYVQRHKAALMERLAQAGGWPDAHRAFAEYGIGIKPGRGRRGGLLLYDLHNKKHHLTASSLDRTTSGPALEKRFGSYEPARELGSGQEMDRYSKRPLQHEPNRGRLYERYLAELAAKKKELGRLRQLKDAEWIRRSEIYDKWNQRRAELQANAKLTSRDRWQLIQEVYRKRSVELSTDKKLLAVSEARKRKIQEIRELYPFSSWTDYLKKESLRGEETALEVLRSKKIELDQARPRPEPATKATAQNRKDLLDNPKLATKDKKRLVALGKLMDKTGLAIKVSISPSGVLILGLPSGGTVRDNGKQVYFSAFDAQAGDVAREYAKIRWGKLSKQTGENCFALAPGRGNAIER